MKIEGANPEQKKKNEYNKISNLLNIKKTDLKKVSESGKIHGIEYNLEYLAPKYNNRFLLNKKRQKYLGVQSPYLNPDQLPREIIAATTDAITEIKKNVSGTKIPIPRFKIPAHGLNIILDVTFNYEKDGFGKAIVKASLSEGVGIGVGLILTAIFPPAGIAGTFILGMIGGFCTSWGMEFVFDSLDRYDDSYKKSDNQVYKNQIRETKSKIRIADNEEELYLRKQKLLNLEFKKEENIILDYSEVKIINELLIKDKLIKEIVADLKSNIDKNHYKYKLLNLKLYYEETLKECLLKRRTFKVLREYDSLYKKIKDELNTNAFIKKINELVGLKKQVYEEYKVNENDIVINTVLSDIDNSLKKYEMTEFTAKKFKKPWFLVSEAIFWMNYYKKKGTLENLAVNTKKYNVISQILSNQLEYKLDKSTVSVNNFLDITIEKLNVKTLTKEYYLSLTNKYSEWNNYILIEKAGDFKNKIERRQLKLSNRIINYENKLKQKHYKLTIKEKLRFTYNKRFTIAEFQALEIILSKGLFDYNDNTVKEIINKYTIDGLVKSYYNNVQKNYNKEKKQDHLSNRKEVKEKNLINLKIQKILKYKLKEENGIYNFFGLSKITKKKLEEDNNLLERLYLRITNWEIRNRNVNRKIDRHRYKKELSNKNLEKQSKKNENIVNLNEKKQKLFSIHQKLIFKLNSTNDKEKRKKIKFDLLRISQVLYGGTLDPKIQGFFDEIGNALSEYIEERAIKIELNRDIVLRELLKNEKDVVVGGKSIKKRIEEKMNNLSESEYWSLAQKGIDHNKKVKEVLDYIWTNPDIEKDPQIFNEDNLQYDMTLFNKYYNKMRSERKGQNNNSYEDQKEILKQIDSLSFIFENHKKNILIHNNEIKVADNIVNRGPQIFA